MHRHLPVRLSFVCVLALAAPSGCGDDTSGPSRADSGVVEAGAPAAVEGASLDATVDGGAPTATGIVVVNSDYSSASVSFLDRDGSLLMDRDGCLNSGSGSAGLAMTLSGDVVLPTQVPAGGPVAILDRGNAAITWLDTATCAVRGQLGVGTGFAANPHDVVTLSASKAYVTRQAANLDPTPAPGDFDDGNDVLIVDPAQLKLVGRIDLAPFAPAGVLPCADRALLAQGLVFVSLNAISMDYATYGEARIVMIDPTTDQVSGTLDLPGVKNCGAMTYVAEAQRLFIACNGAYGDPAVQAAGSAVVVIDLGQSPPAIVGQVAAAATVAAPYSNLTIAALSATTALAVANGSYTGPPPDSLWSLPLHANAPAKLFDSAGGFALGAVLADRDRQRVFVADAPKDSPGYLRLFDYTTGVFVAGKPVKTNPTQKLPPRALAFY